jgi:uncharacterized surface protein with fasciclin (FAS1) repeats
MRTHHRVTAAIAGLGLSAAAGVATAVPATAAEHPDGTRSLAEVLAADTSGFDHQGNDYDVLTAAVGAVLEAKPDSAVAVLADGTVPLTAFLPTDKAFRATVKDLTGERIRSEEKVFEAVAGLGIDTVETVLLYHVVPGETLGSDVLGDADGLELTSAQGGTVTVQLERYGIRLEDQDPNDRDGVVVRPDVNAGNAQIGHGVNLVLRPADL